MLSVPTGGPFLEGGGPGPLTDPGPRWGTDGAEPRRCPTAQLTPQNSLNFASKSSTKGKMSSSGALSLSTSHIG